MVCVVVGVFFLKERLTEVRKTRALFVRWEFWLCLIHFHLELPCSCMFCILSVFTLLQAIIVSPSGMFTIFCGLK